MSPQKKKKLSSVVINIGKYLILCFIAVISYFLVWGHTAINNFPNEYICTKTFDKLDTKVDKLEGTIIEELKNVRKDFKEEMRFERNNTKETIQYVHEDLSKQISSLRK